MKLYGGIKVKRRIVIFALALFAITSLMCITVFADNSTKEKGRALNAIGVFTNEQSLIDSDEGVTRIDALIFAKKIFANFEAEAKQVYSDVDFTSDYFNTAYVLFQQGLDIGINGELNPSKIVTVEDFSKIFVTLTGYDFAIEKYKGNKYPYTMLARKLGILSSEYGGNDTMTYGTITDALYEVLMTEVPDISFVGNDIVYDTPSTMTVMERYMNIKNVEGIIYSTGYSSAIGDGNLKKDQIEIITADKERIKLNDAGKYFGLLGYNVKALYKQEKGVCKAIYVFGDNNNELKIDGKDFLGVSKEKMLIYYYDVLENGRFDTKNTEKNKKIPYDAEFIYNGQYTLSSEQIFEILNNPKGLNIDSVVLLDNDRDGHIEYIIADVYENFGVSSVNKTYNTVTDSRNNVFEYDDINNFYNITLDGEEIDFSKIKVNMVLSIKRGLGKKPFINIEVINKSFLGSFYSLEADDKKAYAQISVAEPTNRGTEYIGSFVGGVDNQLHIVRYDLDNSMYLNRDTILVGTQYMYTILVDKKGLICGLNVYKYGTKQELTWFTSDFVRDTYSTIEFGIGINIKKQSVLSKKFEIELATIKKVLRSVTVEKYQTSEELKIKNIPLNIVNKYGNDWTKYDDSAMNELFIDKLFEISFDNEGNIDVISFPFEEITEGRLSYFNSPEQDYIYNAGILRSLTGNDFIFTSNKQLCIQVPKAGTGFGQHNLYRIVKFTGGTLPTNAVFKLNTYTFSASSCMPEIIVMVYDYNMIDTKDRADGSCLGIVEKASKTSSDYGVVDTYTVGGLSNVSGKGRTSKVVSVYNETYATPVVASDSQMVDGLEVHCRANLSEQVVYEDPIDSGDIVIFTMPHNNVGNSDLRYFTSACKLYDYDTKTVITDPKGIPNGSTNVIVGKIKQVDGEFFSLAVEGRGDSDAEQLDVRYMDASEPTSASVGIYTYEQVGKDHTPKLTAGTQEDLIEAMDSGFNVTVVSRKLIIIYKN